MSSLVETQGLTKHFAIGRGKTLHAVDNISLVIQKNEILGLVGESGCGKSTLGKTLAGLYTRTSGSIRFNDEELPQRYTYRDFRRYSRHVQMIFQDPFSSLNPRMTVRDIVGEGPRIHGLWKDSETHTEVGKVLELVGLSADFMSRYPHEFSGGQRQRIGVARALALRPKFLICDEPISALDVSIQAQVVNLLARLKAEHGLTLLFIAHDLSMVRFISDRMAVMYLGSIAELGPADSVYFEPLHPYTRLLIESNPKPDPKLERARVRIELKGEIPTPINVKPGCRFAGRCPYVMTQCLSETPQLREVRTKHYVACHLSDTELKMEAASVPSYQSH